MQNKAKVKMGKMNVSVAKIKDYGKNSERPTTKVIQNKANFRKNEYRGGGKKNNDYPEPSTDLTKE